MQSILFGVITKSVGSIFRVVDDWQAPRPVMLNTVKRESLLLFLTTAFTTATQSAFSRFIMPLLKRAPRLKPYELLLRAAAASIGVLMAELTSRATAPKTKWNQRLNMISPSCTPVLQNQPVATASITPPARRPLKTPITFADAFTRFPVNSSLSGPAR